MKKLLLISCLFVGCSKDNSNTTSASAGTVSYKLNGVQYSFSNGVVKKLTGTPGLISTTYLIQGFDNNYSSANIFIFTHSDTLKEQSYHLEYGTAPTFTVGNKAYTVLDPPNYYVDVLISSYRNESISGSFSGKVTHIVSVSPSVVEDAQITDGKFENLKVEYH